ncbi:MAG: 2-C-methyl-D-erythritol 4-phosphate cytidylyltransferase [Phycisphaerae bacterium]|nr:2-C-methyl-D-erythritol 4-phosphate cytidylyltransferase [Phycisphaerae bacterium]
MPKIAVIIPAAGKGERFGGGENKIFSKLDGRPVFLRTVEHFIRREDICQILLGVAPEDDEAMRTQYGANLAFMGVKTVTGGARRCDTVAAALGELSDDAEFVAVHDAARPCVTSEHIDAVFAAAAKSGAAILAVPLSGTIKRVGTANLVESTVPRAGLYEAQTPQVFRKDIISQAYAALTESDKDVTDDAELVERAGHPVTAVISDSTNLKITTRADLALASAILKSRPSKPAAKLGAFEEAQW